MTGATFGLVHGAWWWNRLAPTLEARAHRVVAVELPASDPDAGLTRNAEVIGESLGGASSLRAPARVGQERDRPAHDGSRRVRARVRRQHGDEE